MFPYKWNLSDGYPAKGIERHGTTVMTTFACGGGSSMGYKLAGYDVIAANDIDKDMARVYKQNHNPGKYYLCGIKGLINRDDLPTVDVLDGSPPCSVFSATGLREKAWQKDKHFREGQSKQILDDLFFDFIDLAEKMQPKVVIAENVKGMLAGHAKWYTREVVRRLNAIGYTTQVFLLNSAYMNVPQKRQRVFFIAHRKDKKLKLSFKEPLIPFNKVSDDHDTKENMTSLYRQYWNETLPGTPLGKFKSTKKLHMNRMANTILANDDTYHPVIPRSINKYETSLIGSWPLDYNFLNIDYRYLIGMSVPPVMMAQVANQVYFQLIK